MSTPNAESEREYQYVYCGSGTLMHMAPADGRGRTLCGRRWQIVPLSSPDDRDGAECATCCKVGATDRWSWTAVAHNDGSEPRP